MSTIIKHDIGTESFSAAISTIERILCAAISTFERILRAEISAI